MNRHTLHRPALAATTLILTLIVATTSCGPGALPVDPQANVVLITLDTTRADRIGAYGYADVETPHLDALAQDGVLFNQAISSIPLTLPAHTSLFTGLHPPLHGVRDNGGYFLDDSRVTLAEVLRDRGYRTFAAVGAFVLHHLWGLSQGFEVYDDSFGATDAKSHQMLLVQRDGAQVVERALTWIDGLEGEPFFAWLHLYDAHHPYEPPGELAQRYADRPYDGEIAYVDQLVGRVMEHLRAAGLYESSLIVVIGDHGEGLGDHHEPDHGIFLYDSTLRIPLIVRSPDPAYRGVVDTVVRDVDVMPTVLAYLGLTAPEGVQGTSLLPLMAGHEGIEPLHAYSETLYSRLHYGWSELASIRTDRYKYVDAPRPELYDLLRDPDEQRNIYETHVAVAQELHALLEETRSQTADDPGAATKELDPDTLERLQALGYVGSTAPQIEGELPDPKDRLEEMNLLIRASRESAGLLEERRYDEVVTLLEEVLRREPNYMDGYINLASAYRRLGRTQQAIEILERALELTPENVNVMQSLARAHMDLGDHDTAVALYKAIMARSPRYPQAYYGLSEAELARENYAEAVRPLEKLLQTFPDTPMTQYEIGMVWLRAGQLDRAEEWILRSLDTAPRLRSAHFNLALIAEQRGQADVARREYEAELELHPDHGEAGVNYGLLCAGAGDITTAERAFAGVIEHNPDEFPAAYYLLARARVEQGRIDAEALALARRAVELDPSLERARQLARQIERALAGGGAG